MSDLVTTKEKRLCKKVLAEIFQYKALFYGMSVQEKRRLRSTYFINLALMIRNAKSQGEDPVMHVLGIQDILLFGKTQQVNAREYK